MKRRAFTLVELIVVIVILGILAALLAPRLTSASDEAKQSRRMADLTTVEAALRDYHMKNGVYPSTGGAWWGDAPNYGGKDYQGANAYIPDLVPDYLPMLPKDPDAAYPSGAYGYLYRSNGTDYKLLAHRTPTEYPDDHRFYDPNRPTHAWQVSSPGGYNW